MARSGGLDIDSTVQAILRDPTLLDDLFATFEQGDRTAMEQASKCIEQVSVQRRELLASRALFVLELMGRSDAWLVRLRVARIIPRLTMSSRERAAASELMRGYFSDRSSIVRTWAMQALYELSKQDAGLREEVAEMVDHAIAFGTAAMKARARQILGQSGPKSKKNRYEA